MKKCKQCGTQFDAHGLAKYCSDECRKAWNIISNRAWRATEKGQQCERTYREAGKRGTLKTRRARCSRADYKETKAAYEKTPAAKAKKKLHQARYRAKKSTKEYQKEYGKAYLLTPTGRAANSRASARRRTVLDTAEYIDPIAVFDDAKWHCEVCGVYTPKSLRGTYDHRAPELDHKVPLSKGGSHTRDNVQLTCFSCNRSKAASVYQEDMFMGNVDG